MHIISNKKQSEKNNDLQKVKLKKIIYSKLKCKFTKKFIINHLLPILFFLFLSIFIFRNIIGIDGVIINGDFIYQPDLKKFSQSFYSMWDSDIDLNGLTRLPRLLFYIPFIEIGFLFNLNTTDIIVMGFIFCEFLAGISMYYSSRYILIKTYKKICNKNTISEIFECTNCKYKFPISVSPGDKICISCPKCNEKSLINFTKEEKDFKFAKEPYVIETDSTLQNRINIASLIAGLTYMWSFFLLQNYLFPQHRFAYALTPFIILSLIIGLEKKKLIYILLTGFLWCLACADMHWTVHGAILLFSYILYHFLLEFFQFFNTGKFNAFKVSFISHFKIFIILISSFISFSAYWFIPGLFMVGTSRYPATIYEDLNLHFYEQAQLINLMADNQPALFFQTEALFSRTENILNSSVMQYLFLIMGLSLFIFVFIALIMKPKNKYILFFSIFMLITLFLASIPIFSPDLYYWFTTKAPLSNLYGWVFKRPMILQFMMLSLAFLIGFTVVEVITRINKSKIKNISLKKVIVIIIFCLLLFSIIIPKWPLATGDHNGVLKPVKIPNDFEQANSWLEKQNGDFKVLWLPKYCGDYIDWYPGTRINKDIAGLISSKPTYEFWCTAFAPNGYGVHFFSATIYTLNDDALLLLNSTNNFGKFFAPLGIKYIIFHDDNATSWDNYSYKNADKIFNVLKYQNDLELITQFGFIYIFENKYYDEQKSSIFYTNSNDFLIFGGIGSLATLNSIPDFYSRDNGVILGNQKIYKKEDILKITDGIIFVQTGGLEEVAFNFVDEKYFIIPFNYADSLYGDKEWTKVKLNSFSNKKLNNEGNYGEWEKDYGKGVVYTWSTGTINSDYSLNDDDLIKIHDFETETELNNFTSDLTPYLNISTSNISTSGNKSIMGKISQGIQNKIQYTKSELFQYPNDAYKHRISFNLAAKDIINVQIKQLFFNAEKKQIEQQYLMTRSGTFEYTKFQLDVIPPPTTSYYSIQIQADQNPINDSYWWIDDIRLYNLNNITTYARLNINFDVESNDNYEIFMRHLKSENGGKMNIYLDNKQINSLNTYDNLNAYVWEKINSSYLTKGAHKLFIDNIAGFNVINLIAAVPESKMEEYYQITEDFLKDNAMVYILEGESDFYFENATISDNYGNQASFAKVLSLEANSKVWLPIQVLKSGNYSISIKWIGGSKDNRLILSMDNNSYDLGFIKKDNFTWYNITNFSLSKGYHDLKFSISPPPEPISHLSFEQGWNSTINSPENWSMINPLFSMSLDTLNITDGKYSLMITTNSTEPSPYSRVISDEIKLETNKSYKASIDIKTENINSSNVKIIGYNETSKNWEDIVYILRGFINGSTDWREYMQSFFVPKVISQLRVILNAGWVFNTTYGNATIWFDDFKILYDIEEKNVDVDLVVLYQNNKNQSLKQLFEPSKNSTVLGYKKFDTTKYEVAVSANEPFMLVFACAYDEFWVAHIKGNLEEIECTPLYGVINGFYINKIGNFTVIIEYKPQKWFEIGAGITVASIIFSIGYFLWGKREDKDSIIITSLKKIKKIRVKKGIIKRKYF